jgi:RNA polymerase sigma-70 factor (ECF subfamily)
MTPDDVFRSELPELVCDDELALAKALADALAAGRELGLALDDERFVRHIAARIDPSADAATQIGALHARDLYLACACAHGVRGAIERFEREFGGDVDLAFHRARTNAAQLDDVRQLVREKLFVAAPGQAPKIAEYAGRGPLRVWLRVVTARLVTNLGVRGPKETPWNDAALADLAGPVADPELERIRVLYAAEFKAAFARAIAELPMKDRILLWERFGLGTTQEALAERYGVHVNTIARWLARARETLEQGVRGDLLARLALAPGDVTSLLRAVQSRLDVTMGRLLEG